MLLGSGLKVAGTRVAGRFHSVSGWAVWRSCLYAVNAFGDQRPWNIWACVWGMLLRTWAHVHLQQWGLCLCFSYAFA